MWQLPDIKYGVLCPFLELVIVNHDVFYKKFSTMEKIATAVMAGRTKIFVGLIRMILMAAAFTSNEYRKELYFQL